MKFDKETVDLLEMMIERLVGRAVLARFIGATNPIIKELDVEIDAIKAKLTGEI